MLWSEWLTAIAPILGLTVDQAGIILSLVFTVAASLCGGLINDDKVVISMGLPAFMVILVFTYANWLPYFTGSAIALILALLIAKEVSG